jgi:hypothetical protein
MSRTKTRRVSITGFWVACSVGAVLLGCSRDNIDYGPAFASAETRGSVVYERNRSAGHDAENLHLLKQSLRGLFGRKNLPSGAPVTDKQVKATILAGRGTVPPFEHTLDKRQVEDLLRYLHNF